MERKKEANKTSNGEEENSQFQQILIWFICNETRLYAGCKYLFVCFALDSIEFALIHFRTCNKIFLFSILRGLIYVWFSKNGGLFIRKIQFIRIQQFFFN